LTPNSWEEGEREEEGEELQKISITFNNMLLDTLQYLIINDTKQILNSEHKQEAVFKFKFDFHSFLK